MRKPYKMTRLERAWKRKDDTEMVANALHKLWGKALKEAETAWDVAERLQAKEDAKSPKRQR